MSSDLDTRNRPPNAFTVDVEDWFHIIQADGAPDRDAWEQAHPRVEPATGKLLELLADRGVHATFFFLGWIAERHPGLVRRVAELGHEVATHGYAHDLVGDLGPAEFRADTVRAKGIIEDVAGRAVIGYRAASFSITPATPWAFDVLAELGFRYDSSIFPASRAHGGFPLDRRRPFRISGPAGGTLWEFPVVPFAVGPWRVPFAGGGYLRLLPLRLLQLAAHRLNRDGVPVTWYVHPREVDPDQPRMSLPWSRRLRHYVNLRGTPAKLARLLAGESDLRTLASLAEAVEQGGELRTDAPVSLGEAT